MVSSVNSHTNATSIGWHLWEIDFRFATGLPPGWGAGQTRWGTRCDGDVGIAYPAPQVCDDWLAPESVVDL